MKKRKNSESNSQAQFVSWCDERNILIFSIPNGGYGIPVAVAMRLKREGLKSGVPDLFIPIPIDPYHGLFIEMKRSDGGKTTKNQKTWLSILANQMYCCAIAHGFEGAKKAACEYLKLIV